MEGIGWLLAAVVTLSIGSFINVVVHRLPVQILHSDRAINLWRPPSHCPSCKNTLRWRDNIPVISWLLLRGQCRVCHCAISARYPLVEIGCAVISLGLIGLLPIDRELIATLLLFWLLMTLSLIDYDHFLLPDVITLPLLWLGLIFTTVEWIPGPLNEAVWGVVLGYGSLWLIANIYQRVRSISALGMGDVKLVAALGAWLGWTPLPLMLFFACSGAILTMLIGKICGQRDLNHPLAFGPWIALAGISLFIHRII